MGVVQKGGGFVQVRGISACVLLLGLLVSLLPPALGATHGEGYGELVVREVTTWNARDFGASRPVGIAHDSDRREFVIASVGSDGAIVSRVDSAWERLGGAALPDVTNPSTLVYDAEAGLLRAVGGGVLSSVESRRLSGRTPAERTPLHGTDLATPAAATDDPGTGSVMVVDSGGVKAVHPDGNVRRVPELSSVVTAGDLIAHNSQDGLLYVLRPEAGELEAIDPAGETVANYTIEAELVSPEAMTFAPSTDSSDDPEDQHLYVADTRLGSDGSVVEMTLEQPPDLSAQAVEAAALIQAVPAHEWEPPAIEPSGIAWHPGVGSFIVVDSEVNETRFWDDVNLWYMNPSGTVVDTGSTDQNGGDFSDEPTGAAYDPASGTLFVSDDSGSLDRPVHVVRTGPDGAFGTADDVASRFPMDTSPMDAGDTEDPAFDPVSGHLFVLSGIDRGIHRMAPDGGDFMNGATWVESIDLSPLGPGDFEGLAIAPDKETLLVGAQNTDEIFEITYDGELLRIIEVDIADHTFISGLEVAPSSVDPSVLSLWMVDRADADTDDGMLFELGVSNLGEAEENLPPEVSAGPNQTIVLPEEAILDGSVSDSTIPPGGELTSTWSKLSGPGSVTFTDAADPTTTAAFSEPGTYVLRLKASDGELGAEDTVEVTVLPPEEEPPPAEPPEEEPPDEGPPDEGSPDEGSPDEDSPDEDSPDEDSPPGGSTDPDVKPGRDWFTDDEGHVFEGDINAIASEGITRGCNPPDNTLFCPDDPVTRGQMAAFLVRALGYTDDGGGDRFVDDADSVFEGDIDRLATAGVTRGCNPPANDRFCPDENLTRGQMAAFLVRALGYADDGGGDQFVDDDGSVFEGEIDRLATAGVTRGCNPPTNDRFCPDDALTRGQMAAFLARALIYGQ